MPESGSLNYRLSDQAENEAWHILSAYATFDRVPPDALLLEQNAPVPNVYLLNRGLIKLTHGAESGHAAIVAIRSPGWMIGLSAAILNRSIPFTASTLTACEVGRLPALKLRSLATTQLPIALLVMQELTAKNYRQVLQQSRLSTLPARDRLLRFLCAFIPDSQADQGEARLHIPLKQHEVAAYLSVDKSTLSRLYQQMERNGIIRRAGGWIYLINPAARCDRENSHYLDSDLRGGDLIKPNEL